VSGFYSVPGTIPRLPGAHQALPIEDSWYEERTQHPANLKAVASYPVTAVCKVCHRRIKLAEIRQMDWAHVPADNSCDSALAARRHCGT
jgi:hypothetical protein